MRHDKVRFVHISDISDMPIVHEGIYIYIYNITTQVIVLY